MRLRDAFNTLLESNSGDPEAADVENEINEIIQHVDEEIEKLESAAHILYRWSLDDLRKRTPIGPKEPAEQLLKALHAVRNARLLTAR